MNIIQQDQEQTVQVPPFLRLLLPAVVGAGNGAVLVKTVVQVVALETGRQSPVALEMCHQPALHKETTVVLAEELLSPIAVAVAVEHLLLAEVGPVIARLAAVMVALERHLLSLDHLSLMLVAVEAEEELRVE